VARMFATSRAAMILWGMGISQHIHGTDNAPYRADDADQPIGRPTPAHRAAEQRAGRERRRADPMMYPDYQRVDNGGAQRSSRRCGAILDEAGPDRGEIECRARRLRGVSIMGENPAMWIRTSSTRGRRSLSSRCSSCGHLSQRPYLADVICLRPPSRKDRRSQHRSALQLGRQALKPRRRGRILRSSSTWADVWASVELRASARRVR
jgi:formate dehydrogenase major subunit